jgi:hypothetical protein
MMISSFNGTISLVNKKANIFLVCLFSLVLLRYWSTRGGITTTVGMYNDLIVNTSAIMQELVYK